MVRRHAPQSPAGAVDVAVSEADDGEGRAVGGKAPGDQPAPLVAGWEVAAGLVRESKRDSSKRAAGFGARDKPPTPFARCKVQRVEPAAQLR